jgi:hypothetical protein
MRNPCHDEPNRQRKSSRDPRGLVVGVPKSRSRDGPLLWPFQASTNIFKNTTEERCNVVAHHAVSDWAVQPHLDLSSIRGASPDVAIQDAEEGAKGDKKRRKQRHQKTATDDDDDFNKQAGGSNVEHAMVVTGSSKRQARPPTDHFKKFLEETCLNHACLIKHMLRDCSMMKSCITSGSLPRSMEVDEVPDKGDAMPFPEEDAIMAIYDGCPSPERRRMSDPSLGTPRLGCGNTEM